METKLTLEELADQSGLSIRTIRYYIQVGLLDGPDTHGKFASYSPEHLDRLELISRLKERTHLPLEEISKLFRHGTPEQTPTDEGHPQSSCRESAHHQHG